MEPLPVAVKKILDNAGQSQEDLRVYEVAETRSPEHELRMVLLESGEQRVQVICRRSDLLDLARLNQSLSGDFQAVAPSERSRLKSRLGVSSLPALPALTGWPTVVDESVDGLDRVLLSMGVGEQQVSLPAESFAVLTGEARRLAIAVPAQAVGVNLDAPERDRDQLHNAVERFTGLRVRQRLEDTLELPPLPETARRIIQLRVNPNAMTGDLVDIVESDPSLAAQVVSWASSSFYQAPGQVRSVFDAISRVLGFELVMNLAMGLSLGRSLKPPEDAPEGYIGYWQQAIWEAQAAGLLTTMMAPGKRPSFGLAYLSGLLHNFGYLVLNQVFRPQFRTICRMMEVNPHLDSSLIEHHVLGVTREQLGASLMENWGMPSEVVTALRYQKNPGFSGDNAVYSRILWLARQELVKRGIRMGAAESVDEGIYQQLGLDPERVGDQFDLIVEQQDSVLAIAGMLQQGS